MSKILLVEDDNNLREIYGARLLAEGYEIVSAHDGEEALALAIKEHPAMILTDVMMPKISGFDMVDILRSTTETKNIKVIIMTALSQPEDQKRGEQLGANRYLVKSQVTLEDVVKAVHEVLADKSGSTTPPPVAQDTLSTPKTSPVPPPSPVLATPTPQPATPATPVEPQVVSQFTPPPPTPPVPQPIVTPSIAPATPSTVQPTAVVQTEPAQPQSQGGNRVIQPLSDNSKAPSFQELVEQELSKEADQTPIAPETPQNTTPTPPVS